jgi:hypothetical protein
MDFLDLLGGTGQALMFIFKLNHVPTESEYYELTHEQYQRYFEQCGYTSERVFMLIPDNQQDFRELGTDDVYCLTESEKHEFKNAVRVIDHFCAIATDTEFHTFEDKLRYMARILPSVFSKGSRYEKYAKECKK